MPTEKNSPTAEEGYASWRYNIEGQVGGVWIGTDLFLSLIRGSNEIIDEDLYKSYPDQAEVHEEHREWHPDNGC